MTTVEPLRRRLRPPPHPQGTPPGFPTIVVEQVVTDPLVIAMLANLQQRGFAPELLDASRVELLRDAPGQGYRLGEGWLHLHVYAGAHAAETAAASIQDDARLSDSDWVAPPHFFQCDRLIALYLGVDDQVIDALSELCAPPFYTTGLVPPAPAATHAPLTSIEAALAWLVASGEPIHANSSPEVRRTVTRESGVALLYTYQAVQAKQPVRVTRFSYLDWRDPVWYPDGDHTDIAASEAALPPVQFLTGSYVVNGGRDTPELPDRITFAGGRVSDPAIQHVRVNFSDNCHEVVPVENGAYLAARLDVEGVVSIEALDQAGQVIYQYTAGPCTPGFERKPTPPATNSSANQAETVDDALDRRWAGGRPGRHQREPVRGKRRLIKQGFLVCAQPGHRMHWHVRAGASGVGSRGQYDDRQKRPPPQQSSSLLDLLR